MAGGGFRFRPAAGPDPDAQEELQAQAQAQLGMGAGAGAGADAEVDAGPKGEGGEAWPDLGPDHLRPDLDLRPDLGSDKAAALKARRCES